MNNNKITNIRKILDQSNSYILQSNNPDLDLITAFQKLSEAVNAILGLLQEQNNPIAGIADQ